jgi:hypothetical protein
MLFLEYPPIGFSTDDNPKIDLGENFFSSHLIEQILDPW